MELYREACAGPDALSGYYNRNVRVETAAGPVLVRIPGGDTEQMDPRLWSEPDLLAAIQPHVSTAPRLLHAQQDPAFQIHEFIEGRRLDELAPDGKPVPEAVLGGVGQFFGEVLRVPSGALPPVPAGWPGDGDTEAFAERLLDLVRSIRARAGEAQEGLYTALGVPADPCGRLADRAVGDLRSRPFRLLHADLHRKNVIVTGQGRLAVLDWELALWGDPVYDLADHLHKTSYTAADRNRVLAEWERAAPAECRTAWQSSLAFYLAYQEMKSAVVDTVRWGRRIAGAADGHERRTLARELQAKLLAACPHWGGGPPPGVEEIERAAVHWLA
ncbi:aminoglycoside phosphotransferase family protein [Streptomyces toxytricini]|uniref:Aminoglycoside phosphotransferase family protein n=1 Tax=Streptomyces toxytricini TaxID=67369 RepID=A0ABW8EH05_STRT5